MNNKLSATVKPNFFRMGTLLSASSFVVILLLFVAIGTALAATKTVGNVSCTATKTIVTDWRYVWTSNIYSVAKSPIGSIGWTYWTDREYCNGLIVNAIYHTPIASQWDDRITDSSTNDFYVSCPGGTQQVDSIGNHEFKHNSQTWRPNVSASRTRP